MGMGDRWVMKNDEKEPRNYQGNLGQFKTFLVLEHVYLVVLFVLFSCILLVCRLEG